MTLDVNLREIREKIFQLRTAIMYSMSNDVCKLPNSIVNAVRVDDQGQLWFVCQKPLHDVVEYEESFPVRLHFYHKGVCFHLEVSGKASIVDEDYTGSIPDDSRSAGKLMLVCMSMNAVEYTEPYGKKERSRLEQWMEKGYKWMLSHVPHPSKPVFSKNAM